MTEHIHTSLERWLQFHLSMLGYALDTQAQLGQAYLKTLEGFSRGSGGADAGRPAAPAPQQPIIPKDLPPLLRAQWMLGMLFAGWRLAAA